MRKLPKILLALGAAVAAAAVAALVALRLWLPPEKLRAMAVEKLAASLGREVTLGGAEIGLGGVSLKVLSIAEDPRFGTGDFLRADELLVRPDWLALLSRRLALGEVRLTDFELHARKAADGIWNFSTLGAKGGGAATQEGRPGAAAGTAATAFGVGRLRLDKGTLAYEDAATGDHVALARLSASASGMRPSGAFPLSAAFSYEGRAGGRALDGRLDYAGTVDLGGFEASKIAVGFEPLTFEYGDIAMALKGTVKDLTAPQVSLKLSVAKAPPEALACLLPGLPRWLSLTPIEGEVEAGVSGGDLRVGSCEVKAGAFSLAVAGTVSAYASSSARPALKVYLKGDVPPLAGKELKTLYPEAPPGFSLPALAVETSLEWKGEEVSLTKARLRAGGLSLDASGATRLARGKPVSLDLQVKTNEFPLAGLAALSAAGAAWKPSGKAAADLHAWGPVDSPALSGVISVQDGAASSGGIEFSALRGMIGFKPDSVAATLNGRLGKGALEARMTVADYRRAPTIRLEGSLSELDLTAWTNGPAASGGGKATGTAAGAKTGEGQAARSIPMKTSGKVSIGKVLHPNFQASPVDLDWSLTGVTPDMKGIAGALKLRVGPGVFDDLSSAAGRGGPLKALLLPLIVLQKAASAIKIPLFPAFDRVRFREVVGEYSIKNGVAAFKDCHMDSEAAFVSTTGTADLGGDRLDLHVATKLGTQVGLSLSGPVGFTVKGALTSPTIRPDVAAILKQPGVNEAVEQGRKLLKGLFK